MELMVTKKERDSVQVLMNKDEVDEIERKE